MDFHTSFFSAPLREINFRTRKLTQRRREEGALQNVQAAGLQRMRGGMSH
jgi:hypothetical protein